MMLFTAALRHRASTFASHRRLFSSVISTDIAIVGAGHNGLVAAAMLAKNGFKVVVGSIIHSPRNPAISGGRV